MRKRLLSGVLGACVGSLVGCASPPPAPPPKPQLMNGFYIEKPPPSRHRHHKPAKTDTVSRPVVSPAEAQQLSAPPPTVSSADAQPPVQPLSDAVDPRGFVEPPPR